MENQGWEFAFIDAWKKHNHGKLYAIQHSRALQRIASQDYQPHFSQYFYRYQILQLICERILKKQKTHSIQLNS